MYESYLEVDPDRPATSDRSGDVHDGERGDKAAFFILWAGLLMFLLLWAWITIKSCYDLSHQEAPVNNGTAEEVHILSRKERKARLIKYFEDGRHHMVRQV